MSKKHESEKVSKSELDKLTSAINKRFGEGSIMALEGNDMAKIETIPSGCFSLDLALGGGYAKGKIIEVFGMESSGKTTIALHAIAETQRNGGKCAFIDVEHAISPEYARKLGVNTKELLISQPSSAEEALGIMEELAKSGQFSLLVLDSVAQMLPRAEDDKEIGASHMGLVARLMGQAMRKLAPVFNENKVTGIFINQLRSNIGSFFGGYVTPGGMALKYQASQRIEIKKRDVIGTKEDRKGNKTTAQVIKNKVAPPFKTASFDIEYGVGINRESDVIEVALLSGVITRAGAFFSIGAEKFQGMTKLKEFLSNNPEELKKLEKEVSKNASKIDFITGEILDEDLNN